ncbi:MAG: hypothetical protein ACOCQY_04085 [Halorhabdus sp.]
MSSPTLSDHGPPSEGRSARSHGWLLEPVRGVAFWAAIALPFIQLPLLLSGLQRPATLLAFLGLLALNVFALYVGHAYRRE